MIDQDLGDGKMYIYKNVKSVAVYEYKTEKLKTTAIQDISTAYVSSSAIHFHDFIYIYIYIPLKTKLILFYIFSLNIRFEKNMLEIHFLELLEDISPFLPSILNFIMMMVEHYSFSDFIVFTIKMFSNFKVFLFFFIVFLLYCFHSKTLISM